MDKSNFQSHRDAALRLLQSHGSLSRKQAGFLGQITVDVELSPKQTKWLVELLTQMKFPPVQKGGRGL